jgi:NitT/TauT family transport system permease protein
MTSARLRSLAWSLLLGVAFLALWEASAAWLIDPFWTSSPMRVFGWLTTFLASGDFAVHLAATMQAALTGYALAAVAGVVTGYVLGTHDAAARVLEPYLMAIQGIPKVALAPLFIIWFGIGITSKVVLVFLIVYFLVFFNTYGGVRAASLDLRNVMRLLGANDREIALKVVLPATLPWIFVGLKVAVPNAMIGVVVGEFMAASHGLGFLIQLNTSYFHTTAAMALILLIMAIVVAWTQVISQIERYLLRWRPRDLSRQGVEL